MYLSRRIQRLYIYNLRYSEHLFHCCLCDSCSEGLVLYCSTCPMYAFFNYNNEWHVNNLCLLSFSNCQDALTFRGTNGYQTAGNFTEEHMQQREQNYVALTKSLKSSMEYLNKEVFFYEAKTIEGHFLLLLHIFLFLLLTFLFPFKNGAFPP